jgi:hypothetical protein
MAHTEEFSGLQDVTVIACHLSNKSVCKISALLQLPGVNCKCCYCEVETSRSNNGSAAKW